LPNTIHRLFFLLLSALLLSGCDDYSRDHLGFNKIEQIRSFGVLRVVTRLDPTTYYEGPDGLTGLEYDLVQLFAKQLNVRVEFIFPDTFDAILQDIAAGKADIAAAGLTVTEQRKKQMRFAPAYQKITEQVIYRYKRPRKISDLSEGILEVVKGTSHVATLNKLKKKYPQLEWIENNELDSEQLLYLVNVGLIDYTIADSHQVAIIRSYYPKLNIAFDLTKPKSLAWALPLSEDDSLYNEVSAFFQRIKKDGTLKVLLDKHYGHVDNLNYVGNCTFRKHVKERLPKFEHLFKKAAQKYDLDWRFLAAISYQESHWNPKAKSPTGVKGLMMLTQATAKQLGIKNRQDPAQSIEGGARYFKQRLKKIPARIPEPDRIWFALASYNVGFGHLEDARILTQEMGGNPDKWIDVKKTLPLLSKRRWYKKTRHGYARGREPVRYVENIRSYYDLLIWLTKEDQIQKQTMTEKVQQQKAKPNQALKVESPVL
jgi:membrane-bound lytic murein transglycosylase F